MLFNGLLICHIIAGTIALCCSVAAITTAKGRNKHRAFGRWYFYGMVGVFITAIPMAILHSNTFLLLIAIFSFYLAFSGWRYGKRRGVEVRWSDWAVTCAMIIAALIMIGAGTWYFDTNNFETIVSIIFGVIGGSFAIRDARSYYTGHIDNKVRIARHLGGMLGGTIAVFTAVLVVNVHIEPEFVLWLAPTVIFSPLITYWTRKVMA